MDIWHQWDLIKINGWRANGILASVLVCTWTDQVNSKRKLHMSHATSFINHMRSVMPRVTALCNQELLTYHFMTFYPQPSAQQNKQTGTHGDKAARQQHIVVLFVFPACVCLLHSLVLIFCLCPNVPQMIVLKLVFLNIRMNCTYQWCLFHNFTVSIS